MKSITSAGGFLVLASILLAPALLRAAAPDGSFDGLINATVSRGAAATGTGWAADPAAGAPVNRVEMRVDGTYVGNATLGGWRQDVVNAYNRQDYGNSFWQFSYGTGAINAGSHTMAARAYDSSGHFTDFASKTFTVVQNNPPDGSFDGIVSPNLPAGATVTATGWAADPENGAPVDRVEVFIDGSHVGNAALGGWRQDVVNAYNRQDYGNSFWQIGVSTSGLAAGPHTMSATAYDTQGASRAFASHTFTLAANNPPDGSFDGIVSTHVPYGDPVTATGWAADPENGAPVDRVEISIDGNHVGNAVLGGWRQDVVNAYNRQDYGNSFWQFSIPTSGLTSGTHTMSASGFDAQGAGRTYASHTFTVGYRFKILVDTNQIGADEASGISAFTGGDGAMIVNPNPQVDYNGLINTLTNNGQGTVITEDEYFDIVYPSSPNSIYHAYQTVKSLGKTVAAAMVYYENIPGFVREQDSSGVPFGLHTNGNSIWESPNDCTLLSDAVYNLSDPRPGQQSPHTLLSAPTNPAQISTASGLMDGTGILVDVRSFGSGDPRRYYGQHALANPSCAGLLFEFGVNPGNASLNDFNSGIGACIAAGKKCYLLLAPTSSGNYAGEVSATMTYLAQSGQLGNPNVHIILAVYLRANSHVGFLTGDSGSGGNNSVLAAFNAVKAFRNFEN